jgi:hypothetical protein
VTKRHGLRVGLLTIALLFLCFRPQVNCGENLVPWDYWMGTYAGSEADYLKRFGAPSPRADFELHKGDGAALAAEVGAEAETSGKASSARSKSKAKAR